MNTEDIALKKAELIEHGKINIAKGIVLPFYPSRSTAGPGAGRQAMVFGFAGTRAKLSIVRDGSAKFTLRPKEKQSPKTNIVTPSSSGPSFMIYKNSKLFLDNVTLIPTVMHAPGQAFINITSECIYSCSFCTTPELDGKNKSTTPERWIELILNAAETKGFEVLAITSGVARSAHETVLDMVKIIEGVHEKLPGISIGVEPYVTENGDVKLLFDAGATEFKLNLETPRRDIFEKICRGLDYEGIENSLVYAVQLFGKNKVCSNLIVGLGETDAELLVKVEELAKAGIVATLRGLRVNDLNKTKLTAALGFMPEPPGPSRLIHLAKAQKKIFEKYDLSTDEFQTMCHRCKCCDIVPQQDL